ncbi:MAG: RluA family pseudouridine synthase [Proteobacteria bacterium]|nr:RluA family pseudouridine synthase [Pseudomonadota bacterium]
MQDAEDQERAKPGQPIEVVIALEEAGQRLDRTLALRLPELSRSRLKTLILQGSVCEGGRPARDPSARVRPGQSFAIIVPEVSPAQPQPQPLALSVVYEDEQVIVIDKPAGMVVHPAPGNPDSTLVNALLAHCGQSLAGIGGVRRPGIVHRLDKDTSGLMVAAKTDQAHQSLARQFAARTVERAYQALVWGTPRPAAGEISGNIGRSPQNRKKMSVRTQGGKAALTRYRTLRPLAGGRVSLLECRLATGRTHQIRVHLASRGHPVVGDPLYGGARRRLPGLEPLGRFPRQALDAYLLGFEHPTTGKKLRFERPLSNDIKELINDMEDL